MARCRRTVGPRPAACAFRLLRSAQCWKAQHRPQHLNVTPVKMSGHTRVKHAATCRHVMLQWAREARVARRRCAIPQTRYSGFRQLIHGHTPPQKLPNYIVSPVASGARIITYCNCDMAEEARCARQQQCALYQPNTYTSANLYPKRSLDLEARVQRANDTFVANVIFVLPPITPKAIYAGQQSVPPVTPFLRHIYSLWHG